MQILSRASVSRAATTKQMSRRYVLPLDYVPILLLRYDIYFIVLSHARRLFERALHSRISSASAIVKVRGNRLSEGRRQWLSPINVISPPSLYKPFIFISLQYLSADNIVIEAREAHVFTRCNYVDFFV